MERIGHVGKIMRYPVKSFSGEAVQSTRVMGYGIYGDRSHVITEKIRHRYLTITHFQGMVKYKAAFTGGECPDDHYPPVKIIGPDNRSYDWEDEEWREELSKQSKKPLSFKKYDPLHVPIGAIEEENLLIVTDASLRKISELTGRDAINEQRFRPNLQLELLNQMPFIEEEWFSKRLQIGKEVEIEIKRHCERCMIITVDPETGERDANVHKQVIIQRNNHFGVYASVIKTGTISAGDEVWLK